MYIVTEELTLNYLNNIVKRKINIQYSELYKKYERKIKAGMVAKSEAFAPNKIINKNYLKISQCIFANTGVKNSNG